MYSRSIIQTRERSEEKNVHACSHRTHISHIPFHSVWFCSFPLGSVVSAQCAVVAFVETSLENEQTSDCVCAFVCWCVCACVCGSSNEPRTNTVYTDAWIIANLHFFRYHWHCTFVDSVQSICNATNTKSSSNFAILSTSYPNRHGTRKKSTKKSTKEWFPLRRMKHRKKTHDTRRCIPCASLKIDGQIKYSTIKFPLLYPIQFGMVWQSGKESRKMIVRKRHHCGLTMSLFRSFDVNITLYAR